MLAMLIIAFVILAVAVLLGTVLAVLHMQSEGRASLPGPLAALHGLLGIGGLGCLALALRGPPRGLGHAPASFGIMATALIAPAALLGLWFIVAQFRKRRPAGLLIGIHATLAVSGFVMLLAYVFAG